MIVDWGGTGGYGHLLLPGLAPVVWGTGIGAAGPIPPGACPTSGWAGGTGGVTGGGTCTPGGWAGS